MKFEALTLGGFELRVAEPSSGAAACPVVIGLHGRGSRPEELEPLCAQLAPAATNVLVRAPFRTADGFAWYRRGEARDRELAQARSDVLRLMDALRSRYAVGPEAVALWGFSQGGALALEVGLRAASPLAGVLCFSGKLDAATEAEAAVMARARGRDFLLAHGVQDAVVPPELARRAYAALSHHGARIELAELPSGHEVTVLTLGAARGFLASVLGDLPVPAQA